MNVRLCYLVQPHINYLRLYEKNLLNNLESCNNLNVIFQLTDKCVLSCRYCFAKGTHSGKTDTFSSDILESAIRQAFQTRHQYVTFEWTGGEALLVGKTFFEKVIFFQKKYATKPYENVVQTSGFLFDANLIDFLIENQFHLSVTIDGTKEIHDANRPANGNRPSFDQVLKTREYIKERQGNCGFIATITKNNLGYEKEMLEFFQTLDVHSFHSNPYIYYEKNKVKDQSIALSGFDYARYFISQFNAWYDMGKTHPIPQTINYFTTHLASKTRATNTICTFGGRCLTNFIALTPNGDAYNCPKFTGSKNMLLGNITQNDIKDILSPNSPKMIDLIDQRLKALNKCEKENCRFAYICNGGCPYHSFIASRGENIKEKDCLCEAKTMVFEYIEDVISEIVNRK